MPSLTKLQTQGTEGTVRGRQPPPEEAMNRSRNCRTLSPNRKTDITEFDEALVKKLIEKITVFADHFTVILSLTHNRYRSIKTGLPPPTHLPVVRSLGLSYSLSC